MKKYFIKMIVFLLVFALTSGGFSVITFASDFVAKEDSVITPQLSNIMSDSLGEKIKVSIWLQDIDSSIVIASNFVPKYETRLEELKKVKANLTATNSQNLSTKLKRKAFQLCYEPYTLNFSSNFLEDGEVIYCSMFLPVVIANLSSDRILQVADNSFVTNIDFKCEENLEEELQYDLVNEGLAVTNAMDATIEGNIEYMNLTALRNSMPLDSYVNVGIIEYSNPEYRESFQGKAIYEHYPNAAEGSHASAIMEIIVSIVPYATFYCANTCGSNTSSLASEIDWLLLNDVHVINMSVGTVIYDTYHLQCSYIDRIICLYGVTFVKSAGNDSNENDTADSSLGITVPGMAYNAITVGAFDTVTGQMFSWSAFCNLSSYAQKPDISAPGRVDFPDDNPPAVGTSLAAPMITGIAALIIAHRVECIDDYNTVKAILVSSTLDDYSYTVNDEMYRYAGAGVVDGGKVRDILLGTGGDWRIGIAADEYGRRIHEVNFTAGTTVRLSLAYNVSASDLLTYDLANLGIIIYNEDGVGIESIVTPNKNVEIIEFDVETTGVYEIWIVTYSAPTSTDEDARPGYSFAWHFS